MVERKNGRHSVAQLNRRVAALEEHVAQLANRMTELERLNAIVADLKTEVEERQDYT